MTVQNNRNWQEVRIVSQFESCLSSSLACSEEIKLDLIFSFGKESCSISKVAVFLKLAFSLAVLLEMNAS